MKDKVLSIKEKQDLQLQMLDEIDSICREYRIRYSLAYGTLLGAVRHKGFIPWDDDVDICMPKEDMYRFKDILNSENIEYIDIDTFKYYEWFFSRIASKKTYGKPGKLFFGYGVNIDLYPVVGVPESENVLIKYMEEGTKLVNRLNFFVRWRNSAIIRLPIKTIPFMRHIVKDVRNFAMQYNYNDNNWHFSLGGSFKKCNYFDYDLFDNLIDVEFEGHKYKAFKSYDRYLSHIYGDYMKLPPEDQRIPYHGGEYYWK